jgi:hypothetical protein
MGKSGIGIGPDWKRVDPYNGDIVSCGRYEQIFTY